MADLTLNKIEYVVTFVRFFSRRFNLSDAEAYRYMSRYGAISLIDDCYGVMHTQPFEDMVESAAILCRKNGGEHL